MTIWEEIAAIPRLERDAEAALGLRISEGSERAKTKLVEANLWAAVPIAQAMCRKSGGKWEAGDMLSEATAAMTHCADRWDHKSQVRFGAYARMRVRGAMKDFLRKKADVVRGTREQAVSLDVATETGNSSMLDTLPAHEQKEEPIDILKGFSANEREIIQRRLLNEIPDSVGEVASALNLTEAYIRRVQGKAIVKMGKMVA